MVFGRGIPQVKVLLNFRGARDIRRVRGNSSRTSLSLCLQMKIGQEVIGSECAEKKCLFAFPVVDELAANSSMHPLWRFAQVVDLQDWPIFAIAVRKNTIRGGVTAQIQYRIAKRFDGAEGLHCNFLVGCV